MKRLTRKFVETVTKPGRYTDAGSGGLHLFVDARGGRYYVQRVTVRGRRLDRNIGSVRWVTLTEAREKALENWRTARRGGNPFAERDQARREASEFAAGGGAPLLPDAMEGAIAIKVPTLKNPEREALDWRNSFARYVNPKIGRLRVDEVTAADVLAVLKPIWSKRQLAKRVRSRLSQIFRLAIVAGHRTDDPAGPALSAALPSNGHTVEHRKAVEHGEVAAVLRQIEENAKINLPTRLAVTFLVHTGVRSAEAAGARWEEINLPGRTWTLPAGRTKTKADHTVPLTDATVAILEAAKALPGRTGLCFPSPRGKVLADKSMARALDLCGIAATIHGFRTSFRSWCGDTGQDRELAERSLGHTFGSAVEAAYSRSSLLARRRTLMSSWSGYIT